MLRFATLFLLISGVTAAHAVPFLLAPVGPLRDDGGFHIALDVNEGGDVAGVTNEGDGSSC